MKGNIEDAPTRESMRPRHLGYDAKYADRDWFSRSKFKTARAKKVGKRQRVKVAY